MQVAVLGTALLALANTLCAWYTTCRLHTQQKQQCAHQCSTERYAERGMACSPTVVCVLVSWLLVMSIVHCVLCNIKY